MNRANGVLVIGGVVIVGAIAFWWLRRGVAAPVGAPLPSLIPPAPPSPGNVQAANGSAGPSSSQIVGLVAGTAASIIPALIAPGVAAAAIPTAAGITAGAATVGGATTTGSIAATQAATAAATQTTPAGAAVAGDVGMSGMAIGVTIGIAAAVLVGVLIWRARRNETKDDREDFAKSLGFPTIDGLFNDMRRYGDATGTLDVAGELINRALNVIGKHDRDANVRWIHDVYRFYGVEPVITGQSQMIYDAYDRPFDDEDVSKPTNEPDLVLV